MDIILTINIWLLTEVTKAVDSETTVGDGQNQLLFRVTPEMCLIALFG